jgi:membrane protein DedA with SNARE-associated domain
MPALAGVSGMPYRRFLAYNAAGGVVWGAGVVLLGYFAGQSYATAARLLGRTTAVVLIAAVLALVVGALVRRHRRQRSLD